MELTNEFRVTVPVERAWAVLTDVERIAPCLPGAELQEIDGDEYRGVVRVKVGPITAQYRGAARFVERDDAGRRAVLRAEGRDTRGQGNANATITATLAPDGDGTRVQVVTDLTITGKVAQFGRGVLADVSAKLLDQFVERLETDVLAGGPDETAVVSGNGSVAAAAPAAEAEVVTIAEASDAPAGAAPEGADSSAPDPATAAPTASGARPVSRSAAEPVDLLEVAGGSVARRVGPAVGAVLFLLWVFRRRRRRR